MKRSDANLNNSTPTIQTTADRLLLILKMRGPQTAIELGAAVGITDEAARQQMTKLAGEGLVESLTEVRGVGRPKQIWKLTASGNGRFPDAHSELTVQLITSIKRVLGEESMDRLISAREEETLANYLSEMEVATGLGERIMRLAAIRDREGYMCELKKDSDGYLLIENHCPICEAAAACQGFCYSELRIFKQALGDEADVVREEHIVSGDRRCVYRITRRKNKGSRRQETGGRR